MAENKDETTEKSGKKVVLEFLLRLLLAPVAFGLTIFILSKTEADWQQGFYLITIIAVIGIRIIGLSPLYLLFPLLIGMKAAIMGALNSGGYSDLTFENAAMVYGITYGVSFLMVLPALFLYSEEQSPHLSKQDKVDEKQKNLHISNSN